MRVQKMSFAYMSEGMAEDFQLCAADIENDARALPDPYHAGCVEFCDRYDQNCFDPGCQSRPFQVFEPMVRSVFTRSPRMVDMAGVSAGGAE
jgi:hypothetical protein